MTKRAFTFDPGKYAIVRIEDPETLAALRADAIAYYKPVNPQDMIAVERLALAQHDMLRVEQLIAGFHTASLDLAMETPGVPYILQTPELTKGITVAAGQNRGFWLATGFRKALIGDDKIFASLMRYQAQTERLYRRAVEEFERLEKRRTEADSVPMVDPGVVIVPGVLKPRPLAAGPEAEPPQPELPPEPVVTPLPVIQPPPLDPPQDIPNPQPDKRRAPRPGPVAVPVEPPTVPSSPPDRRSRDLAQ